MSEHFLLVLLHPHRSFGFIGLLFPSESLLSILVFRNKLSHSSPEWPGIYYVAQADLSENTVSAECWSYRHVLLGPARNLVLVFVFWLTSVEWGK